MDIALLKYAQLFINNVNASVTIFDTIGILKRSSEAQEALEELNDQNPKHIAILRDKRIDPDWLDSQDLMIISIEGWKDALAKDADWIEVGTSTLVIKP